MQVDTTPNRQGSPTSDRIFSPSSPLSLFNIIRFKGQIGENIPVVIRWAGTEPRVFPKRWSIKGKISVFDFGDNAIYVERFFEGRKERGHLKSECVSNNPN